MEKPNVSRINMKEFRSIHTTKVRQRVLLTCRDTAVAAKSFRGQNVQLILHPVTNDFNPATGILIPKKSFYLWRATVRYYFSWKQKVTETFFPWIQAYTSSMNFIFLNVHLSCFDTASNSFRKLFPFCWMCFYRDNVSVASLLSYLKEKNTEIPRMQNSQVMFIQKPLIVELWKWEIISEISRVTSFGIYRRSCSIDRCLSKYF